MAALALFRGINARAVAAGALTSVLLATLLTWLALLDPTDSSPTIQVAAIFAWAIWLIVPGLLVGVLAESNPVRADAAAASIALLVDLCALAVAAGGVNIGILVMSAFGAPVPIAIFIACSAAGFALRKRVLQSRGIET